MTVTSLGRTSMGRRRPIPVLLYHSISDDPAPSIARLSVAPADFRRHLDALLQHGARALTVSAFAHALATDSLPERVVVLTFDDGFADNLEVAAPELHKRGFPATVYITTDFVRGLVGRSTPAAPGRMLSGGQLRELESAGLELAAHSRSHPELDVIAPSVAYQEIWGSKRWLEDHLGHEVTTFSYPYGYYNRRVREQVKQAGFASACGVGNVFSHPEDDRWSIARLSLRRTHDADTVAEWLDGHGARITRRRALLRTAWREARLVGRLLKERRGLTRAWDTSARIGGGQRGPR